MSYPGGKAGAGVYQSIINQMPPHELYVEPFLGGGAIMRHKRPARSSIGLDADAAAIAAFPRESVPGLRLDCFDGILWLCEANRRWKPGTLVYCDPPYLLEAPSPEPASVDVPATIVIRGDRAKAEPQLPGFAV